MPRVQRGKVAAISTRWTRRVAAPCVCFVPWAALASCRPLPQQLLPVSAAGGGRRRCKQGAARPFQPQSRSQSGKMLAASLNAFFSLLRFEGPSAAAAAAPRRGAGAPSPSPSVTPCPLFCRCATSSPDRGKSFKGRGKKHSHYALGSLSKEKQEARPPRSWLSLRESWREAPERVCFSPSCGFPAGATLPQGASASRYRSPLRPLP